MKSVFILWHSKPIENEETDDKFIGVYSSLTNAEAAKGRCLQFATYQNYPDDFLINEHEIDADSEWVGDLVTWGESIASVPHRAD